ncbi:hypothetical protein ACFPOF_01755 [Cohnella soli]|uniref:Uncharacterized protein n=2 Tax=Cohnella soli TaxID=425005 RepID=A0ABW0HMJ3_9BACL
MDMIRQYGVEESDGVEILVDINQIHPGTELSKEFIGHAHFILNKLNYATALLPIIGET